MYNIFGVIVLVIAWNICGDDSVVKGAQNYQYFYCYSKSKTAQNTAILPNTNGMLVTNGQYFWCYCPAGDLADKWGPYCCKR